ncbi:MAG: tetratricopeptide repeat protein [Thermodesulfovibrionales bacterium]|jgi:tetratricopeptide (TPR) repeat protein
MKKKKQRKKTGPDPLRSSKSGRLNDKGTRRHVPYYLAAFVSLIALALYLPALRNDLVSWDDTVYVITNLHIRSLNWAFFKWAFSDFYASNWHPLTWLSHAFDYAFWGLNPLGHHLTNNILHAMNTFLVVLLCIKLLEMWKERSMPEEASAFLDRRKIMIAAGVTGLLFGLHPLHVESVAWVAERKDLLCGLFFLLSISAYTNYIRGLLSEPFEKKKTGSLFFNRSYLVSLAFFVLALLSKPMAVSLPVVLLLLDWYPFQRIRSWKSFRDLGVEKLPFIVCSLISSILTIMAQRTKGAMEMMALVPLRARMLVAAKAIVAYLGKIAVPVALSPYYPYPELQEVTLASPQYLFAVIFVVGLTAILLVVAKKQRVWLSAWGYYVATLIPVIGIIQVGSQSMADRYMYLPSLGPFLLIGLIAAWVWSKADSLRHWRPAVKGFTIALAISLVISLSYVTLEQIAVWKDDLTLFTDMVRKSPNAPVPHNDLGNAYLNQNRLDEAVHEFLTALKLKPDYAEACYNLATAYLKQNRLDEAVHEFLTALKLKPDYAAHANLAAAYLNQNRLDEAVNEFFAALKLEPDSAEAHYNLATAYLKQNRLDEAVHEFLAALKLEPDYAEAHTNLATAYLKQNRLDEAVNEFLAALKLRPDFAEAHTNLATTYLKQNRLDEAVNEFLAALKLKPDFAEAHNNLGTAYLNQNRLDKAVNEFLAALKLRPDYAEARYNLGTAYAKQDRFDEAVNEFLTVLKIKPDYAEARNNLEFCYERIKDMKRQPGGKP